jgi:hypothetical protein
MTAITAAAFCFVIANVIRFELRCSANRRRAHSSPEAM